MAKRQYDLLVYVASTMMLGIFLLDAVSVQAHNGAMAIAVPVESIIADGDLSDWPEGMRRYPVLLPEWGVPPEDAEDFQASFRVGYNAQENALYVGMEVRDESTVIDTTGRASWNTQDGGEIYVDVVHKEKSSPAVQYAMWGHRYGTIGAGGVPIPSPDVQVGTAQEGAERRYEWRIDIEQMSRGKAHLHSGMSLGFDVVVCDGDGDGSFSWMAWGRGAIKLSSADRRGDVVLVGEDAAIGRLQGTIQWEDLREGSMLGTVRIQSSTSEALWVQVGTDEQGAYEVELPTGVYHLVAGYRRRRTEGVEVEVTRERTVRVRDIFFPRPPLGWTVEAGTGRTVKAGTGVRQGVWQTFDVSDGLPHPVIFCMYEDRDGDLWFGTENGGVTRYDGVRFTTFTADDGLAHSSVWCILQDRTGNLWFGTQGGGVSRYEAHPTDGGQFTTFTMEDGLGSNDVRCILQDRTGNLWFGTQGGGVSRYDGKEVSTFATESGLPGTGVLSIMEDREGVLWFGTDGGVSPYDGERFETFTLDDGPAGKVVTWIVQDPQGNLWFSRWGVDRTGYGVTRYDGTTIRTFTTEDGLADNGVSAGVVDQNGDLWFGTDGGGVSRYEAHPGDGGDRSDRGSFTTFTQRDGLAHNEVFSMLEDREGNLWFGTISGVTRYGGTQFTTFTTEDGLADEYIRTVLQDRHGHLWFGTVRAGVSRYDGEEFVTFTTEDGLAHNQVLSMLEDREGNVWVGTSHGVNCYNGQSFAASAIDDALVDNWPVSHIVEDRDGHLWFGAANGAVSRYDGVRFTIFTQDSLAYPLYADREGNVWFGGPGGASRYDGRTTLTFGTKDGLANEHVNCMVEDRHGRLWFGTWGGVSCYDGEAFTTFTTAEGLVHNAVLSILEDREGNLWFGTFGGVSRYDGFVFQNLLRRDGLVSDVIFDLLEDRRGDVWIATLGGVVRYRTRRTPPDIALEHVVANRRYGPVGEIELSSSQPLLLFEFRGRSFKTHPDQMRYVYRLQGYDPTWRQTRETRAEYADLPVGEYVFEVKAVDRDLDYSTAPATVHVAIHPAYGRIAFAGIMGLTLIALVMVSVYGVRRRRERDQVRERFVREQERRIEVQQRLVQELEETSRAKSMFLANMSHELRTPMNSILGFTELMKEGIFGNLPEAFQEPHDEIHKSGDHLLALINDVLDLSKIEAGKMELHRSACAIEACIESAASTIRPLAEEKGLKVITTIEEGFPTCMVDEGRILQVLLNLAGNAVKFTREGEVEIGARKEEEDLFVWVRDTGVGIPLEKLEEIFGEFGQSGTVLTREQEGTGLGLSISKRIVELHGGEIGVESEVERGSTFWFRIPMEPPVT